MKPLRTSELARAAGVHPNTIRRYEARGWLPPAERDPNGYRRFTQRHVDCLRLARLVSAIYATREIRYSALRILPDAAGGDWGGALTHAEAHLALVRAEQAQAEAAVGLLERSTVEARAQADGPKLRIGEAARRVGVSIDVLRNWERNGLVETPREPSSGYRLYGPAEIRRLRIVRMLTRAGYSQMAVLRMLRQLERGGGANLREALTHAPPDEDLYTASDRWLATLAEQEERARGVIALIEAVILSRALVPAAAGQGSGSRAGPQTLP